MSKALYVALLAAGLMAAPLPQLTQNAAAQTETKAKKPPTAAQLAERERIKKCGKEWKEAKAAGKVEKGMKWPQYLERLQQAAQSGRRLARNARRKKFPAADVARASAKLEVSPTPSFVIGTGAP